MEVAGVAPPRYTPAAVHARLVEHEVERVELMPSPCFYALCEPGVGTLRPRSANQMGEGPPQNAGAQKTYILRPESGSSSDEQLAAICQRARPTSPLEWCA